MSNDQIVRAHIPGWVAGLIGATCALIAVGFLSIGFYASLHGLMIAATVAFMAGTGAAALADARRAGVDAAVVAFYLAVLIGAYLLILPALARPGAHGGAATDMP